jgi:hypothetical protein
MVKRLFFLFVLLSVSGVIHGCKSPEFDSRWTDRPMFIDGEDSDWDTTSLHRFEESQTSLGLCNDIEYLYILVRIDDPVLTRMVGMTGISLWFSRPNEKKKDFGISYSGSDTLQPDSDPMDSFWECLTPNQKTRFRKRQSELIGMITVIEKGRSLRIPSDSAHGPKAAKICLRDSCCYEFMIPIRKDVYGPYAIGSALGETIQVGVTWGDSKQEEERMKPLPMGMFGGGIGGMRMEGKSGPMQGMQLPGRTEMWFQVILADAHRNEKSE